MDYFENRHWENVNLEAGQKVKVYFANSTDYYVGVITSRYDWFAHDKTFYYVSLTRLYKDGKIQPPDRDTICVPAWMGVIKPSN